MAPRSYRSRVRPLPCEQCRKNKVRCRMEHEPPCLGCRRSNVVCIIRRRAADQLADGHRSSSEQGASRSDDESINVLRQSRQSQLSAVPLENLTTPRPPVELEFDNHFGGGCSLTPGLDQPLPGVHSVEAAERLSTQFAQSIDDVPGCSAQLLGASAESDPWLLRHCRFDEFGLSQSRGSYFRSAGGVPPVRKIPVHFLVSTKEFDKHTAMEEGKIESDAMVAQLEQQVPIEYGPNLFALFFKHVFPMLPIISRSQLGITATSPLPSELAIKNLPVYLTAAIYASALSFRSDDSHICIWTTYHIPDVDRLWEMVYDLASKELNHPRLAVLQALLLYLQRPPTDTSSSALSDTPFVWSLVGSIMGLTTSMGLHVECQTWAIPAWEKRLRRRLWWAAYAEDKWRSLLLGRPPYIRQDEWDVSDLQSADFGSLSIEDGSFASFRDFLDLTKIAESVQSILYNLKASQILSCNFNASVGAANPILHQLSTWRASASPFAQDSSSDLLRDMEMGCPAPVQFAYLVLVTYVYRALLRPMVPSLKGPDIIDLDAPLADTAVTPVDWILRDLPEADSFPAIESSDRTAIEEVLNGAEHCAASAVTLMHYLPLRDLCGFWPSWSRIGFALISSYVTLLLVQAPNAHRAARARDIFDLWERKLKDQSPLCPLMRLGLTRLYGYIGREGMPKSFYLSLHVRDAICPFDQ